MWQLAGDGGSQLSSQAPRIVSYLAVQGSDTGWLAIARPLVWRWDEGDVSSKFCDVYCWVVDMFVWLGGQGP